MQLDPVRIAAALVSPWPTWRVEAEDEPTLVARIEVRGPVPQADLFEPWDPSDPWTARVLWPDLSDPDALLAHGQLEDGVAPGMSEWMDRGRVGQDELFDGEVRAVCTSDLESGGLLLPDLVRLETDAPDLVALGLALLASVGATGEDDQVTLVQHRTTGRLGLLLEVVVPDTDPLAERQAVVAGVASVVRRDDLAPRLAPDLQWWFDLHRVAVLAWLVAPSRPVLPVETWAPVRADRLGARGLVEVQAVVGEAEALGLGEVLGAAGFAGSRPRWVLRDGAPALLTCWTGPADAAVPDLQVDGVPVEHRVVPGCPPGLEGDWLGIDPSWWASGGRIACRWHCSLRDRDLLPQVEARPHDAVDQALAGMFSGVGAVEPVIAGRPALRLKLPALDTEAWEGLVEAIGAIPDDRVGPVAYVAMGAGFTVLLFRTDLPEPETAGAWEVHR